MPILESALGIENAFAIATASDRSRRAHHRPRRLHRRPRRARRRRRARVALRAHARGQRRPCRRMSRPSTPSTATSPTPTACCAGARLRAPWALKAWAASIPRRSRSSTAPSLLPQPNWRKPEDRCRLRRRASARPRRGESRLQDDRRAGRAARPEAGGAGQADGNCRRAGRRSALMSATIATTSWSPTPSAAACPPPSTAASNRPTTASTVTAQRATRSALPFAATATTPPTATSVSPISRPRCACAACATA